MSEVTEGNPSANESAALAQMVDTAKDDVKESKALDAEIAIATHRKEAIKAIPSDIVFNVLDGEEKDEKGNARPQSFRLVRDTARDLMAMQGVTNGLYDRWRRIEPVCSDTFCAPECYTDPKSVYYKGLTRALELTNSRWVHADGEIKALLLKGVRNLTDQESILLESARTLQKKANRTITIVRGYLKEYYEQGLSEKETSARKRKTVQAIIAETINTLFKRSQAKNESVQDKGLATLARDVLLLVQSHPQDVEMMVLRFNAERKAKPKSASEALPVLPSTAAPSSKEVEQAIEQAAQTQ